MALYTLLTKNEIKLLLEPFGFPPPSKIKGILEGTVNTYYQLLYHVKGKNKIFYLKIDEVGDLKRLKKEIKILILLENLQKKLKFKTPQPLYTLENQLFIPYTHKFVLLFPQIKGHSHKPSELKEIHLRAIGQALGRLHRSTQKCRIAPHRFHLGELKRVFLEIKPKLVRKHPHLSKEILKQIQWLEKNKPHNLPYGLIHADLFPENTLFLGDKLEGILDFEAAGSGPFLFDIAVTLHACCHPGKSFSMKKVQSFLKGYEKERKLKTIEKKYFSYFLYESALRFLLTRLRDFELKEGAIKAKPFKNYKEYVVRFSEILSLVKALKFPLFEKR